MSELFPIQNPVLVFALVATLILLAPIVMGRWRLPGMIGLLFAGAVLGPNALGVLARDQSFVLFGTVGLLYIMFSAALEIDMAVLKRTRFHSLLFGLLTFAIPQGVGTAVARYLLGFEWPAAILLASMFASHTLLTYPIASRLGISRNQAVTTAVGGTIITDTLALLVLAVIAGATRGEMDDFFWYRIGIGLGLYVAVILIGLPILARWFFHNIGREGVSEFVFVLATVFACASLSHLAGSEPIVGAFLAGLALNRLIPHNSVLMNRIQFTGEAVFIPFFLLSVGMLLDVSIFLGDFRAWAVALSMVVTVVFTKWLAAEATRPLLRFSRDQARVIFGLSVPQAAATLAATLVGYEIGLFDDAVVNGAILMILVSCFIAPIMVDRYGRRMALASEVELPETAAAPQRILVACSTAESARPLLELAMLVRDPGQNQAIYPLTVVEEGNGTGAEVAGAEKVLADAVGQLAAADVPAQPVTRIDLNPGFGILRARRELRGTEVVVGWRGHTTTPEFFFGTLLEHLLQDRHYTLLVTRFVKPLNTCNRVILAVPPHAYHEEGFPTAVGLVNRLARQLGAPVQAIVEQRDEAAVKRRMQSVKPAADFKMIPIERWRGLVRAIADQPGEDRLVVLYAVRPGGLAWHRSLGSLPTRLAEIFPDTNLLIVYPPEAREEVGVIEPTVISTPQAALAIRG